MLVSSVHSPSSHRELAFQTMGWSSGTDALNSYGAPSASPHADPTTEPTARSIT